MATTKKRINISVSKGVRDALVRLARRDQEPVASKAADLLERALDIEEDRILEDVARSRDAKSTRPLSHRDIWDTKRTK